MLKNVNPASVNCDPVTPLRYVIQLIWEGVKNGIFRTLSSIGGGWGRSGSPKLPKVCVFGLKKGLGLGQSPKKYQFFTPSL